jgi:peptidoglycan/LPS O-acetylase OafA/YrhL
MARQEWPLALGYTASLAVFMLALAFCRPRLQAPFAHPAVRWLAEISYGVFLIHVVVIWFFDGRFSPPNDGSLGAFLILAAVVVPVSLLYGYLSARFLEQPIRRWAHRYGRRAQEERPPPPSPGPAEPSRAAAGR